MTANYASCRKPCPHCCIPVVIQLGYFNCPLAWQECSRHVHMLSGNFYLIRKTKPNMETICGICNCGWKVWNVNSTITHRLCFSNSFLTLFWSLIMTTSICQVGVGIVWLSATEHVVTHELLLWCRGRGSSSFCMCLWLQRHSTHVLVLYRES